MKVKEGRKTDKSKYLPFFCRDQIIAIFVPKQ